MSGLPAVLIVKLEASSPGWCRIRVADHRLPDAPMLTAEVRWSEAGDELACLVERFRPEWQES